MSRPDLRLLAISHKGELGTSAGVDEHAPLQPRLDSVLVIVRTVGERTTALCERLAQSQARHVVRLSEKPFSEAVRRGFELGVEVGLPWTLCLDADVLLRHRALIDLVDAAERQPESTFCVEGQVADKLLGHIRFAGNHLYRTSLLPYALRAVDFTNEAIRPENHVKRQMAALGHGYHVAEPVVGLHDFEQFFVDVFRKALVHRVKFADALEYYARAYWAAHSSTDPDLRVALWALHTAPIFKQPMQIDRRVFPDSLTTLLQMAGMEERGPLSADAATPGDIARQLGAFEEADAYRVWRRFVTLHRQGLAGRARAVLDRYGIAGTPLHFAERLTSSLAQRLRRRLYGRVATGSPSRATRRTSSSDTTTKRPSR